MLTSAAGVQGEFEGCAPQDTDVQTMLASHGLRFDTRDLAVFSTQQLLLWLQPAAAREIQAAAAEEGTAPVASAATTPHGPPGIADMGEGAVNQAPWAAPVVSGAEAADAMSGVAPPASVHFDAACFSLDGPPTLAPAPVGWEAAGLAEMGEGSEMADLGTYGEAVLEPDAVCWAEGVALVWPSDQGVGSDSGDSRTCEESGSDEALLWEDPAWPSSHELQSWF